MLLYEKGRTPNLCSVLFCLYVIFKMENYFLNFNLHGKCSNVCMWTKTRRQ